MGGPPKIEGVGSGPCGSGLRVQDFGVYGSGLFFGNIRIYISIYIYQSPKPLTTCSYTDTFELGMKGLGW